ncbi:MAG: 2Fe-2S iron-sulfur cluster-binding protein [Brevibacterium sp.]
MRYRRNTLTPVLEEVRNKAIFRVPSPRRTLAEAVRQTPEPTPATATLPTPPTTQPATAQPVTTHPALVGTGSAVSAPAAEHVDTMPILGGALALAGDARPGPRGDVPGSDELTGLVEVVRITEVTHDVKTFELWAPWLTAVDFEPGQYVTMRVPELGLERCYSISSAPFGTNTFTVTVKRVPTGIVSTHLHERVRVGDLLHVDGPYGLFSTSFHPAAKHLFLSAGSGITPIMAMVRSLLARPTGIPTDIVFVHNAATPADIIFRAELEQLAEVPGIRVVTMCSRDSVDEAWSGRRGRITQDVLAEAVPDAAARETFVCGPNGYMDTVRPLLVEAGVTAVHEESFVFAKSPGARLAQSRARGRAGAWDETGAQNGTGAQGAGLSTHAIDFSLSGQRIDCDAATTVLDAAVVAGMTFPSSCEEGACGTCKSVLLSGEVEMNHAGGIRPKEIAAGKFLPCCSTPLSDLIVER